MNQSPELIIEAARAKIGLPFRHHYRPSDVCVGGLVTLNNCLTRGLDDEGFDCSGLIIASVCAATAMQVADWPRKFRHLKQMEDLATAEDSQPGDAILFREYPVDNKPARTHMGIFVAKHRAIHANGISGYVDEGKVQGDFELIRTIPAQNLLKLLDVQQTVAG
ncbi:MAG: NlpC/P60 family protein [Candidatus Saccharimonadales bacterium]